MPILLFTKSVMETVSKGLFSFSFVSLPPLSVYDGKCFTLEHCTTFKAHGTLTIGHVGVNPSVPYRARMLAIIIITITIYNLVKDTCYIQDNKIHLHPTLPSMNINIDPNPLQMFQRPSARFVHLLPSHTQFDPLQRLHLLHPHLRQSPS
jgi:hypothetical protein